MDMNELEKLNLDEKTENYLKNHILLEDEYYDKIRKILSLYEIKTNISSIETLIISTITSAVKPKKVIEIGSLGGFFTPYISKNISDDGQIYIVEKEFSLANAINDVIKNFDISCATVINENPLNYLEKLSRISNFDLCIISKDFENYPSYLKWALNNTKNGGLILVYQILSLKSFFNEGDDKEENKKLREMKRFFYMFFNEDKIKTRCIIPTENGIGLMVLK